MEIKWNQELFGVEIKDNENHFVISAQPSMVMDWDDAKRYYKNNKMWQLPTREQLQLSAKYIDMINTIIIKNGGYKIRGWCLAADEYDESCARGVNMIDGYTINYFKYSNIYVRAVSNL
jgi:hypothetical protein